MALGAGSFKSWDESLHPRDRRGRFAKKWGMGKKLVSALDRLLNGFKFKQYGSQQQASQKAHGIANKAPKRFQDYDRLSQDWGPSNDALRAGTTDASTQKFVNMMNASMTELPEDEVLYRKVGPEVFGLTPEQMSLEDGGLEDITGKLLADKGYTSTQIGGPHGQGPITMAIAAPKGTKVVAPGRGPGDPELILDKEQPIRITKVEDDGRGGFNVFAIASDSERQEGETPTPFGQPGVGQQPDVAAREAQIGRPTRPVPAESPAGQITREEYQRRVAEAQAPQQPAAPGAPAPRQEQLQSPGMGTQAPAAPAGAPEAPSAPEAPGPVRVADFRESIANIPAPSAGPRRKEFNLAIQGLVTGKKDPQDVMRDLDSDIEVNKRKLAADPDGDAELERDIGAQEQLADAISNQYGVPRGGASAAPEAPGEATTPAKQLPSSRGGTDARGLTTEQREAVVNRLNDLKAQGRFNPENEEHQRTQALVDQIEGRTPTKRVRAPAAKKAAKAAPAKAAKKAAPAKAVPEAAPIKKATPRKGADRTEISSADFDEITLLPIDQRDEYARLREGGMRHEEALARATGTPAKKAAPRKAVGEMTEDERRARLAEILANPDIEPLTPEPRKRGGLRPGGGGTRGPEGRLEREREVRETAAAKKASKRAQPGPTEFRDEEDLGLRGRAAEMPAATEAARRRAAEKKAAEPRKMTATQRNAARKGEQMSGEVPTIEGQEGALYRNIQQELAEGRVKPPEAARRLMERSASYQDMHDALPDDPDMASEKRRFLRLADQYENASKALTARAPRKRTAPGQPGGLSRMTKEQLVAEAAGRGITVRKSWTKDRILEAINAPAAPEAPGEGAPEAAPDLDKMLKKDLLAEAARLEITAVRPSWTKDRIKQSIRDSVETRGAVARRAETPSGPDLTQARVERQGRIDAVRGRGETVAEALELVDNEGSPAALRQRMDARFRRGSIDEPTRDRLIKAIDDGGDDENAVRDNLARVAREIGQENGMTLVGQPGEILPASRIRGVRAPGGGGFKDETMVRVNRPAVRWDPGDGEVLIAEGVGDEATPDEVAVARRAGNLSSNKLGPDAPINKPITTDDRRDSFRQALQKNFKPDTTTESATEVQDDVLDGTITPDEGLRRLESEIKFDQDEINDIDATLRENLDLTDDERNNLRVKQDRLNEAIRKNTRSSSFMRKHFQKDEPTVTPDEAMEQAKTVAPNLEDRLKDVDLEEFREGLRAQGFKPEGDTAADVFKNALKEVLTKEIERRGGIDAVKKKAAEERAKKAAKKAATKITPKAVDKPKPTPEGSKYERIDANAVAEGLDLRENDRDMLGTVQELLDGDNTMLGRNPTPARIGTWLNAAANVDAMSPRSQRALRFGGRGVGDDPESQRIADDLTRQADEWTKLADRLKKTRRKARKAPEPTPPPPKVDKEEKKEIAAVAELTGIPAPQLEKRALAKKQADAPPKPSAAQVADTLRTVGSREEAEQLLKGRTSRELDDVMKAAGIEGKTRTKADKVEAITRRLVTTRLEHEAFKGMGAGVPEEAAVPPRATPEVSPRGQRIRALRERARESLREQGINEPSSQVLEAQMQSLEDIEARELIRERSGGRVAARPGDRIPDDLSFLELGDLVEFERRFDIPRTSLNRQDRIEAVRARAQTDERVRDELIGMSRTVNARNEMAEELRTADFENEEAEAERIALDLPATPRKRAAKKATPAKKTAPAMVPGGPATTPSMTGPAVKRTNNREGDGQIGSRTRPNADEAIHRPNGGHDQGRMHLDSAIGELWGDLYADDRPANSYINKIAILGEDLGTGKKSLNQAIEELRTLRNQARGSAIGDRVQRTLDQLDAPAAGPLNLPEGTPDVLRRYAEGLADIPTARKPTRNGGKSPLDRVLEAIREIAEQKGNVSISEAERKLVVPRTDVHESVDGATGWMWRLADMLTPGTPGYKELQQWIRNLRAQAS